MKPIRFSRHVSERLHDRSATEEEVIETIRTMPWTSAGTRRFECQAVAQQPRRDVLSEGLRPQRPGSVVRMTAHEYALLRRTVCLKRSVVPCAGESKVLSS